MVAERRIDRKIVFQGRDEGLLKRTFDSVAEMLLVTFAFLVFRLSEIRGLSMEDEYDFER